MKVPFNIPYLSGKESVYVQQVINNLDIAKSESYINKCRTLIKDKWNINELYLTNSCTAALEVSALLLDIKPGDEIIVPSYTFPSTATAFIRQGAKIVFADSRKDLPIIDENRIESLITKNTKAIVPVHYAGIACDMDRIMKIADKHDLYVVEDDALGFESLYKSKPLGGIGHLGCLSFHKTKNLQCGEGGAILLNDSHFIKKVQNILEKGTNRNEFVIGNVKRYEWVEVGSSFLMTELHAAYLYAQLEKAQWIKQKRYTLWNLYYNSLKILEDKRFLSLPRIPDYAEHNAHTFYIILDSNERLTELKSYMEDCDIQTAVHYSSLDLSPFWKRHQKLVSKNLESLRFNNCLLRLPLYNSMTFEQVEYVTSSLLRYFNI